jgi:hypothetical protein
MRSILNGFGYFIGGAGTIGLAFKAPRDLTGKYFGICLLLITIGIFLASL